MRSYEDYDLPNGWTFKTIPELVSTDGLFIDGDWVESKDQDPNGEVRLVQLADIGDGTFRNRSSRFLTKATAERLRCTFLTAGDVLIARMPDPLGRACIFPGDSKPCITAVDVCIVRSGSTAFDHRWLMWFINSPQFRHAVASLQSGSTRKRISRKNLGTIPLPVPPLDEQQGIVEEIEEHLTRLDAGVAALERVRANLKRYRAAVLKAACEGRLVPTEAELSRREGRSYEPASALLERIKAEKANHPQPKRRGRRKALAEPVLSEDLRELPEGWVWTTLGEIAELKGGVTKSQKRRAGPGMRAVPYLRVANVQRGYLDLQKLDVINATEDEILQLALKPGDVLFNEGGDRDKLGRGWVWQGELPLCIHQNHVFRARLLSSAIEPKFISWYGNSSGQSYFFSQGKQTTNLASINLTKLSALPVPLPPGSEQRRIVFELERTLSIADDLDHIIEVSLQRADRLRQAVLAAAFAGRLTAGPHRELSDGLLLVAEELPPYPAGSAETG